MNLYALFLWTFVGFEKDKIFTHPSPSVGGDNVLFSYKGKVSMISVFDKFV